MLKVYLIQCGQTDYQEESRLQGRLSLPLSDIGLEQCENAVRQLREAPLAAVYAPPDEACQQTGKKVAKGHKGCKVRKAEGLAELNLGLWQGALVKEIQRRQPKVYRRWREEPTTVTPPEGESFKDAYRRVAESIDAIVTRHNDAEKSSAVALVLPPMAAALVRCYLSGRDLNEIWELVGPPNGPETYEVAPVRNEE